MLSSPSGDVEDLHTCRFGGMGDLAMSFVMVFAAMVSLSALGLLAAYEDK
jgi:hypothetical protein